MAKLCFYVFVLGALLSSLANGSGIGSGTGGRAGPVKLSRNDFPPGFVFGAGASAYQNEGGADLDGRGPCVWDTFTTNYPEKIADGGNGSVAIDFYHRYKEDIALAKELGLDSYRFSLGWSRILPKGKLSGGVNPLGIEFYNNVINEIIANGLTPFVTLLHFDPPQALDDEYGGLLSSKIVDDYLDYANLCFTIFGDRVKNWVTVNEPNIMSLNGYALGAHAPGRCSEFIGVCPGGDSGTEPYVVAHNLLLLHAKAVKLYREKYQPIQKGKISITIATHWFVAHNESSPADQEAARRAVSFQFDWFVDPVVYGDYPKVMRALVGSRLPSFTEEESALLKNSFDFLGVNYYTSYYATPASSFSTVNLSYTLDSRTESIADRDGVLIGEATVLDWLHICPFGLRDLSLYIKDKYNNPPVIINENGMADPNNSTQTLEEALNDTQRLTYLTGHLSYLLQAIKKGANVKGYYVWGFADNFEWASGYTVRFGMVFIDYDDNLKRYKKRSAEWFQKFLLGTGHAVPKLSQTVLPEKTKCIA